jgi:hypothetical protein
MIAANEFALSIGIYLRRSQEMRVLVFQGGNRSEWRNLSGNPRPETRSFGYRTRREKLSAELVGLESLDLSQLRTRWT